MEDLQELQDLQNQKIEELKEKLQELNNRVSFDEYDCEEESIEEPIIKPKNKTRQKIKKN